MRRYPMRDSEGGMIAFATLSGRVVHFPAPTLCPRYGQSGQRRLGEKENPRVAAIYCIARILLDRITPGSPR
jgi:hypothetical protein